MQVHLLILTSAMAVCYAGKATDHFLIFKEKYKKQYSNEAEEKFRRKIFKENHKTMEKHNQLYEKGEVSFKLGINHLADMHLREFSETLLGFNKSLRATNRVMTGTPFLRNAYHTPKSQVDWRTSGAVTPVKNQGKCGSCWAFSATGALEGHHFLKEGKLVMLSEQNLVDCSSAYGNNGCQGGLMEQAFQYVRDNKGVDTEVSYPYEGEDNECRFQSGNVGATDTGFATISSGDEEELVAAVSKGPVSAAIDATHRSFMLYSEGVYYEPECNNQQLDHGILIVGYGTTSEGVDYWLIKNSWGPEWGEEGYVRMARGRDNHCGIATQASFPMVS